MLIYRLSIIFSIISPTPSHDSYPSLRYLFFSCRHHVDDDVCDHLDDIEDGDDEDALVIITVVKKSEL